jgi:hypothetical protein
LGAFGWGGDLRKKAGTDQFGGVAARFCVPPDSRAQREMIRPWGSRPRENETVRTSYDEGVTRPVAKSIERGRCGYADIAVSSDGTILCLYERGHNTDNLLSSRLLSVARFNLERFTDGKDFFAPKARRVGRPGAVPVLVGRLWADCPHSPSADHRARVPVDAPSLLRQRYEPHLG